MARFLLVHGASHGAWCWARVIPHLEAQGHVADAIDLPGHGDDPTPRATITLADYADAVLAALRPDTILVGHSFGGFPITLAAARAPEMVAALVYLCALVPEPGRAFRDLRAQAINPELASATRADRFAGISHVIAETGAPLFYSGCNALDQAEAVARTTPEPIGPMLELANFTPPEVPTHYIRCAADRVVLPAYQTTVSEGWRHVHEMDADHSPFLSDPEGLARILDRIATETA